MNRIDKNNFYCERLEHNIIYVHVYENADMDVTDIVDVRISNEILAEGKEYFVLFDIGTYALISKEAREFGAKQEFGELRKAMAIIVKSLSHRLLANFFININKPPTPTKVFNTKEKALEWLQQFVDKI